MTRAIQAEPHDQATRCRGNAEGLHTPCRRLTRSPPQVIRSGVNDEPGRLLKKGAGNLANLPAALQISLSIQ